MTKELIEAVREFVNAVELSISVGYITHSAPKREGYINADIKKEKFTKLVQALKTAERNSEVKQ